MPARIGRASILAIAVLLGIGLRGPALAGLPAPDSRPSFSCSKAAATVEAAVCADPRLAARDHTLSVLFAAVRVSAAGVGPSNELAKQREWLALRDTSCTEARSRTACLANLYDERLYALALAALFTAHDPALAELRRQTPKDAQVYEAIYRYATIANPKVRAKAVAPLIAPTFEAVRIHPAQDIGGMHVPSQPERRLEDIPTAEAATATDDHFAAFLDVAFMWAMDQYRAKLPCATLARRPGLLPALGQRWDPSTDCEETLPPTPLLDALLASARKVTPDCGGTIRIDLGADFAAFLVAKRLNLHDKNEANAGAEQAGPVEQDFRQASRAEIAAASQEMAHYYAAYFGLRPSAARKASGEVVDGGLAGVFACEREG